MSSALNDATVVPIVTAMGDRTMQRHLRWMRRRNLRQSTIEQRRRCLTRVTRWLGHDKLLEATELDLEAYVDGLPGAADGKAVEIWHIKDFYRWAIEFELLADDPSARLQRPRVPRRLPRPIADADLALALREAPASRIRPILYLAAYAGLRAQDMCGLRVEDINWSERQIIIRDGKGGHEDIVDMCEILAHALRTSVLPERGWMFPYLDGRPGHWKGHRVSQTANRYLRGLGITATLHQLRHWAGTEFYRATRDLRATQAFLRHRSIVSTTIYTAVDRDATLAGVDQLPDLGRGAA